MLTYNSQVRMTTAVYTAPCCPKQSNAKQLKHDLSPQTTHLFMPLCDGPQIAHSPILLLGEAGVG
jgi:hypothetical protein